MCIPCVIGLLIFISAEEAAPEATIEAAQETTQPLLSEKDVPLPTEPRARRLDIIVFRDREEMFNLKGGVSTGSVVIPVRGSAPDGGAP